MQHSAARERVIEAAERLFAERGYNAVTVKDIAAAAGIRHVTLYHHVPQGKPGLFLEVMERILHRHRDGLHAAIVGSPARVRDQLQAVARWFLSQPPMDMLRLARSDLPDFSAEDAMRIQLLALESTIEPIHQVLVAAQERGEITHTDLGLVAGGLFGLIESMHLVPPGSSSQSREDMANTLIDALLHGLLKR